MNENITPGQAAHLLRAKAAQLEEIVLVATTSNSTTAIKPMRETDELRADIALVASLLAELWERLGDEVRMVPIGDPLFNEDGTPWEPPKFRRPLEDHSD